MEKTVPQCSKRNICVLQRLCMPQERERKEFTQEIFQWSTQQELDVKSEAKSKRPQDSI